MNNLSEIEKNSLFWLPTPTISSPYRLRWAPKRRRLETAAKRALGQHRHTTNRRRRRAWANRLWSCATTRTRTTHLQSGSSWRKIRLWFTPEITTTKRLGWIDVVKCLIEFGADVNAQDRWKNTIHSFLKCYSVLLSLYIMFDLKLLLCVCFESLWLMQKLIWARKQKMIELLKSHGVLSYLSFFNIKVINFHFLR